MSLDLYSLHASQHQAVLYPGWFAQIEAGDTWTQNTTRFMIASLIQQSGLPTKRRQLSFLSKYISLQINRCAQWTPLLSHTYSLQPWLNSSEGEHTPSGNWLDAEEFSEMVITPSSLKPWGLPWLIAPFFTSEKKLESYEEREEFYFWEQSWDTWNQNM